MSVVENHVLEVDISKNALENETFAAVGVAESDAYIGKRVSVDGYGLGRVRFFGLHKKKHKPRVGVELEAPIGKNNGTIDGEKYFECNNEYGVLVLPEKVRVVSEDAVQGGVYTKPVKNGSAVVQADGQRQLCSREGCYHTCQGGNILCPAHLCGVAGCLEAKASNRMVCAKCQEDSSVEPAAPFAMMTVNDIPVYVDMSSTGTVALWLHPRRVERQPPMPSIPKKMPKPTTNTMLRYLVPQPKGLPTGWHHLLTVPIDRKGKGKSKYLVSECTPTFFDENTGVAQEIDPRPDSEESGLQEGWTIGYDEDGDPYFADWAAGMLTYDDPRIVAEPKESKVLGVTIGMGSVRGPIINPLQVRQESIGVDDDDPMPKPKRRLSGNTFSTPMELAAKNTKGFKALDENLTQKKELPSEVVTRHYNRHLDVLPNPSTRVVLQKIKDYPNSDYINANYIRSADGKNPHHYIAAMGPKAETVGAFWRMIMENNIQSVVMITGLLEKGSEKCYRYWPKEIGTTHRLAFDGIVVENVGSSDFPGGTKTLLKAQQKGRSTLEVMHWWFTAWPDHGTPKKNGKLYADDVISTLQDVKRFQKLISNQDIKTKRRRRRGCCGSTVEDDNNVPPILLHCSAGIGRTGTFLAIDHGMEHLESLKREDTLQTIATLRLDRCALVQHPKQYQFVHTALSTWAASNNMKLKKGKAKKHRSKEDASTTLSPAEAKRMRAKEKAAAAARATSNNNETLETRGDSARIRVDPIEYDGVTYRFVDSNGDAEMTREQARSQGMSDDLFDAMDEDKSGTIDIVEFKNFSRRLAEDAEPYKPQQSGTMTAFDELDDDDMEFAC